MAHAVHQNRRDRTSVLIEKAQSFQARGQLEEAGKTCREILRTSPRHADALHLLGIITHQSGRPDEAAQWIAQSLTVSPRNASALRNLAAIHKKQGRLDKAVIFYEAALEISPRDTAALNDLGIVYMDLKRADEAAECFNRVLAFDAKSSTAHYHLGLLFQSQGKSDKALEAYRRALAIKPRYHQALGNMAGILNEAGNHAEAIECCESAIEIEPNAEIAYTNFSIALRQLRRYPEAIERCRRALQINPRSHQALNNLGHTLTEAGRHVEGVACLKQALQLKPGDCLIRVNLGFALQQSEAHDEALVHFRKAAELVPGNPLIHRNLATALYRAGDAEGAAASFRKALEIEPDCAAAFSDMICLLNYLPHDPEECFARNVQFDRTFCAALRKPGEPRPNRPDPRRRLRVGYISGDFHHHSVSHFIEPVFANYSHEEFEVFCYANQRENDGTTARLRGLVDGWRFVLDLDDDELAGAIKADGIDILVDLSGHTAGNRLLVFARKPAPVQVTMIGYMQTTGVSAIDYRITDEVIDPAGIGDRLSAEKLVRLPAGPGPFRFPTQSPAVNELPALKNGYAAFASFHNLAKVHAGVIETWAKVLHALPDSRLIMVARCVKTAVSALMARGIAPERIEAFERLPMEDYLAIHHRVDLVFDTFPFNGYTTNLLSGWMGVPFVTIAGHNTVSRVGESLLKMMGIPELLAADREDFVRKAVDAVSNLPRLAQWRAALRPRLEAWAGDGSIHTRQLETAFHKMWWDWCKEQSTESITPEKPEPAAKTAPYTNSVLEVAGK